jgi:hypothetical protein
MAYKIGPKSGPWLPALFNITTTQPNQSIGLEGYRNGDIATNFRYRDGKIAENVVLTDGNGEKWREIKHFDCLNLAEARFLGILPTSDYIFDVVYIADAKSRRKVLTSRQLVLRLHVPTVNIPRL